jgi:protein-S-isoprenylcysteine O-methyltransferase Ste14
MSPAAEIGGRREGALERAGRFLYRYRSYTPLPLVAIVLFASRPTALFLAVGLPLAAAGETVRLAALRHIGGASRSTRLGAEGLVDSGPYRFTRNPLYLGNLFLSLGLAIATGLPWLPPLLLVLFAVQYAPIVASEEEELERRFGEAYVRYAADTPRFLPRAPRRPRAPARLGWEEAVRVERRSLAAVALLVAALAFHFLRGGGGAG